MGTSFNLDLSFVVTLFGVFVLFAGIVVWQVRSRRRLRRQERRRARREYEHWMSQSDLMPPSGEMKHSPTPR